MRPSKSTKDMELDKLLEMTLKAMAASEDLINEEMASVA